MCHVLTTFSLISEFYKDILNHFVVTYSMILSFFDNNDDNKLITKPNTKTTTNYYYYCNYWLQLCVLGLQLLASALKSWAPLGLQLLPSRSEIDVRTSSKMGALAPI